MAKQDDKSQSYHGDDWDVVTATVDGGLIWKRYRDGKIVVTRADENPQEVLARDKRIAPKE
jgi:hypothetical protein